MKTYATPVAFKQALEQRLRTEVAGDESGCRICHPCL